MTEITIEYYGDSHELQTDTLNTRESLRKSNGWVEVYTQHDGETVREYSAHNVVRVLR